MKIEPAPTSGPGETGDPEPNIGGIVGGSLSAVIAVILVILIALFVVRRRYVTVLSYFIYDVVYEYKPLIQYRPTFSL